MAKFCTNCGKELSDNAKFCAECGTPVALPEEPKQEVKEEVTLPEQIPAPEDTNIPEDTNAPEETPVPEDTNVPEDANVSEQNCQSEHEAAPAVEYEQAKEEPALQTPVAPIPNVTNTSAAPENKVVSSWAYFGLRLVFSIPLIGLIVSIILACAPKNKNLKNFSRSNLLWVLFCFIMSLVLIVVMFIIGVDFIEDIVDEIMYEIDPYYYYYY